ncbi:hypothetical protein [Methylobacterium sp. P1-11]|uniref:hypothetical protein n=1 Tax=Methylobacterium sp. P1-11 TaxID=2024616 RepID=UPI0032B1B170
MAASTLALSPTMRITFALTSTRSTIAWSHAFRNGISPVVTFSRISRPNRSISSGAISAGARSATWIRSSAAFARSRSCFSVASRSFRISSRSVTPSSTMRYSRFSFSSAPATSPRSAATRPPTCAAFSARNDHSEASVARRRSGCSSSATRWSVTSVSSVSIRMERPVQPVLPIRPWVEQL